METESAIGDVPDFGGLESFGSIEVSAAQAATAWQVLGLLGAGILIYYGGRMIVTGKGPFTNSISNAVSNSTSRSSYSTAA